jgi:adenylate kinase family enzyme
MKINTKSLLQYKRINVVGSPGSGKSTLSSRLSELLNIEMFDLDDYLYDNNCNRLNSNLTSQAINELLSNEYYIIDGTYTTTFQDRLNKLDLVILTNRNTIYNIITFIIRFFSKQNLKCGERFTLKTSILLFNFNVKIKPAIIESTLEAGVKMAIYNRKNDELQWLN